MIGHLAMSASSASIPGAAGSLPASLAVTSPGAGAVVLAVQAALLLLIMHLLVRRVAPTLAHDWSGAFAADVALPLALLTPFLFAAGTVEATVVGAGWVPVGGPVVVGAIAGALALIVGAEDRLPSLPGGTLATWAVTGVVVMLLAAVDWLTLPVGQIMLVIALVILWINSSVPVPGGGAGAGEAGATSAEGRAAAAAGMAATMALGLSLLVGLATLLLPAGLRAASAGLVVAAATCVLAAIARLAGPVWALRVGGWVAVVGTLGGIGIIALCHLVSGAMRLLVDPHASVTPDVARGFATLAPEAALLVMLPFVPLARAGLEPPARRAIGGAVLLAAAAIAAWRIASG